MFYKIKKYILIKNSIHYYLLVEILVNKIGLILHTKRLSSSITLYQINIIEICFLKIISTALELLHIH